jgi:hypothetical protein
LRQDFVIMVKKRKEGSTCLGSAIVPLLQDGRVQQEASILVFLESGNGKDSEDVVRIHLLSSSDDNISSESIDASTSSPSSSRLFQCQIPVSKLSSLWSSVHWTPNADQNKRSSNLQRLFLGDAHTTGGSLPNDPLSDVNVSYEHVHNSNESSVTLMIRQMVASTSMMKIVHQASMEVLENEDATMQHCRAMAAILNESLRQQQLLQGKVSVWKRSLEEHSRAEEVSKATLVRNFTVLRNALVKKHQEEVDDLKAVHAMEKKQWQSGATKRKRPEFDVEAADDVDNDMDRRKALFDDDLVNRLADKGQDERRERTLNPNEAVNFVQVQADLQARKKSKQKNMNGGDADEGDSTESGGKNFMHTDQMESGNETE